MASKFNLGGTYSTPGALAAMQQGGVDARTLLARHVSGDWGDVDRDDARANDRALTEGSRIFSVYKIGDGVKLWVITEADRSSTTMLLPEEY